MNGGRDLHYAPQPSCPSRWFRPRRVLWTITVVFLLSAFFWWTPFWWSFRVHYYFFRCEHYTPDADAVIYDHGKGPANIPPTWARLYELLSPPGFISDGTIFLHRLRTPSGKWRLVAVDLTALGERVWIPGANTRVIAPGRWLAPPSELMEVNYLIEMSTAVRVLPGRVVPGDETRFTFSVFDDANRRRDYEGYMESDDHCVVEPISK